MNISVLLSINFLSNYYELFIVSVMQKIYGRYVDKCVGEEFAFGHTTHAPLTHLDCRYNAGLQVCHRQGLMYILETNLFVLSFLSFF